MVFYQVLSEMVAKIQIVTYFIKLGLCDLTFSKLTGYSQCLTKDYAMFKIILQICWLMLSILNTFNAF